MKKIILLLLMFIGLLSCQNNEVNWDATGTFEATEVTVSAEGNGAIEWLSLEDGQLLDSGVVVGYIDTIQLHLKKLQLLASKSGAINRRLDIAKQLGAVEAQIAWQQSERRRFEKLASQNAATQKQVDDITNQLQVLEKQRIAQNSQISASNQSITDEALAIETQVAQIDDQINRCAIVSPIGGTVLIRYAEAGEFASTGKPLFTIANLEQIYLRAYITASQLTQMKLGQTVKVYSDSGADGQKEYAGVVEWISSRAEFTPKSIQTRDERANQVYAVKIRVKNDGYLKIGMYGQVVIN